MLALLVEFRIRPERAADFAAAIAANARASRETEPGCRQFDVCREPADAGHFWLYELYDDAAAIDAHLAAPHFRAMDEATRAWVLAKTVHRLERIAP